MSNTFPRRFFPARRVNIETTPDINIGVTMTRLVEPTPCDPAKVIDDTGNLVKELGCGEVYQLEPCIIPPCDPAQVIDAAGELVKELGCGEIYQLEPCPCAPETLGWLIQPTTQQTYLYTDANGNELERHPWEQPLLEDAYIEDIDGRKDTNAAGRINIIRLNSLPMYGDFTEPTAPPPPYPNPHKSWLFLGAPFGDSNAIKWEWEWDISPELPEAPSDTNQPNNENWWAGHTTEQIGNYLQVRVKHGYIYDAYLSEDFTAILTAKAYCGETEVGTLSLEIILKQAQSYYL